MEDNADSPTKPIQLQTKLTDHHAIIHQRILKRREMIMSLCEKTTSVYSNPLFSTIVTLCALIFLYFPTHFTAIVFSPVIVLTAALLLSLLRLGAEQSQKRRNDTETASSNDRKNTVAQAEEDHDHDRDDWSDSDSDPEPGLEPSLSFELSFVQWNLRAPLEIIYEGDEENDSEECVVFSFSESESDISSDGDISVAGFWVSPEKLRLKWEEEERDDDGLIEIALDGNNCEGKRVLDFHVDEDNLIEIDISSQVCLNVIN